MYENEDPYAEEKDCNVDVRSNCKGKQRHVEGRVVYDKQNACEG